MQSRDYWYDIAELFIMCFFRIAAEHELLAELEKKERELAKEQRMTYV